MRLTTPLGLRDRATRRGISLGVLLILLLLQAQMAIAGCLMRAPPAGLPVDASATAQALPDCHTPDPGVARECLQHCEQAAESPASSADRSAGLPADPPALLWAIYPDRPGALPALSPRRASSPRSNGPPVYLRLSRLRN